MRILEPPADGHQTLLGNISGYHESVVKGGAPAIWAVSDSGGGSPWRRSPM